MAVFYKDKEITSVNYGTRPIAIIYRGARMVWQAIRSCFGKGFWINSYPWDNKDAWKNNI